MFLIRVTNRLEPLASQPGSPGGPGEETDSAIAVLEREETDESDGDADRFAHYVRKDRMQRSQASGKPVIALCGKVWTPRRDPSKYPVCPACKEIYEKLQGGGK